MVRGMFWICFGLAPLLSGCFSHTAVPITNVSTGADVRAHISAAEAGRLRPVLGREKRILEGQVVGEAADGIQLRVSTRVGPPGASTDRLSQIVSVRRPEILEIEVRELDRWKTAGVVALSVGVGAWWVASRFSSVGGSQIGGVPTGGGGDNSLLPPALWIRLTTPRW